jgi:hypothetical protein
VLERAHVDADLVRAAGLELDGEQAGEPVCLERVVVRDAAPAVGSHGELEVVLGMPGDRRVDGAGVRVRMPLHQRVVRLVDAAGAKRLLEHRVRVLGLRHRHQTAGADVEPLHHALTLRRARGGDPHAHAGEMADHGGAGPADAGMRRDPDRLVDHHDVVVLEHDVHALDPLGHHGDGLHRRDGRLEDRTRLDPLRLLRGAAVERDEAVGHQLARAGARQPEEPGEGDVDTLPRESFRHGEHLVVTRFAHGIRPVRHRARCAG